MSLPLMTFSTFFSEMIIEFQRELARNVSGSLTSYSWTKISDLFDGRLFVFTLYQIHRSSSNIRFDSTTIEIIKQSLTVLNIPFNENLFSDVLNEMMESKDIIIASSPWSSDERSNQRQKITKISNRFIDKYLKPILSPENQSRIEWIDPNGSDAPQYSGRYHWHVYREVKFFLILDESSLFEL